MTHDIDTDNTDCHTLYVLVASLLAAAYVLTIAAVLFEAWML